MRPCTADARRAQGARHLLQALSPRSGIRRTRACRWCGRRLLLCCRPPTGAGGCPRSGTTAMRQLPPCRSASRASRPVDVAKDAAVTASSSRRRFHEHTGSRPPPLLPQVDPVADRTAPERRHLLPRFPGSARSAYSIMLNAVTRLPEPSCRPLLRPVAGARRHLLTLSEALRPSRRHPDRAPQRPRALALGPPPSRFLLIGAVVSACSFLMLFSRRKL